MTLPETFFLLIAAHCLCDYPLQGDFLARAKNHRAPVAGVPWWLAMSAHCGIHAGAVLLITGSLWLAVAEYLAHFAADWLKSDGRTNLVADQLIHVGCKLLWVLLLASANPPG